MKLKNMILTAALAAGISGCSTSEDNTSKVQEALNDTLTTEYVAQPTPPAKQDSDQSEEDNTTLKVELPVDITNQPNDSIYTIDMDRIRNGALGKSKKINHNFSVLLGGKRSDSIMLQYNKQLIDTLLAQGKIKKGQSVQRMGYNGIEDVKVPMVYPRLKDFFVPSLQKFLADKPEIEAMVGNDQEVIIVTRAPDGNHAIGYYKDGRIFLAAYMSGGVGKDANDMDYRLHKRRLVHAFTTEGVAYTNLNWDRGRAGDRPDSLYVSGSFKSSMPYAIPVEDDSISNGEFYHIGSLADGKARSHTCRRQAAYVAMILWDVIGDRKVKSVTHDLYDAEQKTCKHFPEDVREEGRKVIAAKKAEKEKKKTTSSTSSNSKLQH